MLVRGIPQSMDCRILVLRWSFGLLSFTALELNLPKMSLATRLPELARASCLKIRDNLSRSSFFE